MDSQTYSLLTTVLGALITGLFGIINTIITLRAKKEEKVVIERINEGKFKPTRMLLLAVLISVGAVIGFYIGNATKNSPSIVKHYSQEERGSISRERIAEIERQIHEIEQERAHIIEQPRLPEPEKEEMIQSYNERINQLTMERSEYEEIAGQPEQENKERRIQRLQNEIELNRGWQREAESKVNHLMPHIETDPDARSEIEQLRGKVILLQQERDDMNRELGRLREHH
ncbi:MAG: hypothetical protein KAR13_15790 [Desulfobulbaceae bacterium]|nr:hypothetical protein [Desulfobulbaceae bacterium]